MPGGAALSESLGGRRVISREIYEVVVDQLDLSTLRSRRDSYLAPDIRLEVWMGPYLRSDIDTLAALRNSIYATYGIGLSVSAVRESLIAVEPIFERRGIRRVAVLARDPNDAVVGIVETMWNPNSPRILTHWFEAVVEARRGHRLGASLTAALLLEIVARWPTVAVVRIGMHHAARAIHRRTEEIGFRYRHAETEWVAPTDAILSPVSRRTPWE